MQFGPEVLFGMMNDWQTLHQVVTNSHLGRPGHRRVVNAQYRLFDGTKSGVLIELRYPPAFAAVFRHGATGCMSIHFNWDDHVYEPCTGCGLVQACKIDTETKCASCGRSSRAYAGDVRVEELGSESNYDCGDDNSKVPMHRGTKLSEFTQNESHRRQHDSASAFDRISFTKQNDAQHHRIMAWLENNTQMEVSYTPSSCHVESQRMACKKKLLDHLFTPFDVGVRLH